MGEGQLAAMGHAAVLEATAEERDLEALALVQAGQRPHAVAGHMAGREQDRLHANACS